MFSQTQAAFGKLYNKMAGWLNDFILALPNLVVALLVLCASYVVARFLKSATHKGMLKFSGNRTVANVIANVTVAAFMVVALFVALNILNLSDAVTALLGTAGVIGLAIGLALQDPLINLFSGVLMSVREKYNIGDFVETNSYIGTIEKITLRSTILRTTTGQDVVIPNKEVIQAPLVNYTVTGQRRIDIDCGVSYGDDLEKVVRVATAAIENSAIKRDESRPVEVFFKAFGSSSIDFTLRFWNYSTRQVDFFKSRNQAIIALKKAFDENGITIPFPITTLDFGIEGGVRIDELYPAKQFTMSKNGSNGNSNNALRN
jgi:small conductance mechanosensitive channel